MGVINLIISCENCGEDIGYQVEMPYKASVIDIYLDELIDNDFVTCHKCGVSNYRKLEVL